MAMIWTRLEKTLDAIQRQLDESNQRLDRIEIALMQLARDHERTTQQSEAYQVWLREMFAQPATITQVSATDDDDWLRHFLKPREEQGEPRL